MRILYITQYFPPEVGATQTRALEMTTNLVKQGHEVTVLTEFPNHPVGIIPPEYKGKWVTVEKWRGMDVIRTWVYARQEKNFKTRMGFYLSFMATSAIAGSYMLPEYDIVYTTSPPFFVGLTGYWLSRLKNAKFIFEVRDLWPDSAVQLGELTNRTFIRWAEKLETFYYNKAERIVTVTQGIKNTLTERGYGDKTELVLNGTNTDLFKNMGPGMKKKLGLENKFVVLYAGIIGIAQGLEQICDVAEQLQDQPDIAFVLIGEGPVKHKIEKIKQEKSLKNLILMDQVPRDDIPQYISMADCCLVPLKKNDLFMGALPSKMFDYMACEKPVILSVDGEARSVLESSGAGIFVEPENRKDMISAILSLKSGSVDGTSMGLLGREFVEKGYSRKQQALELLSILEKIVRNQ